MIAPNDQLAAGRKVTLAVIETQSQAYETESTTLEEMIDALEADLETVKQKHLRGLKRQAGIVASAEAALIESVELAPELFKKPRTLTLHGVKVGYAVNEGKLVWDIEDETLITNIEDRFGRSAGKYLRLKKEIKKDQLRLLPAADLTKLNCRIEGAGDTVVVKRVAGDVEKLIAKLTEKLVEAIVGEA